MKDNHSIASTESAALCDQLFHELERKIKNLRISHSKTYCGFFQEGHKRFVYINHRQTMSRIQVWCLGDPKALATESRLIIHPRTPTSGGFGTDFRASFYIERASDIETAAQLLYRVSYRES